MGHHVVDTVGKSELAQTLDGLSGCRLICVNAIPPAVDKGERRYDVVYFDMREDIARAKEVAARQAEEEAGYREA